MNTKFENEINKILKRGSKELKKTGTIRPKAYIFGENGKVNVVPMFFSSNPIDKRLAIGKVRDRAKYHKAKCVVLINDSFISDLKGIRPSLDPFRKEGILLTGEDESGKLSIIQEYTRGSGNKIKLGKITTHRGKEVDGLFIEEPFGVDISD